MADYATSSCLKDCERMPFCRSLASMIPLFSDWHPRHVVRFVESLKTSTLPVLVETDAGRGVLKAVNNPAGLDALICEALGTALARWIGLTTFDAAPIVFDGTPELPLARGHYAAAGTSFITRYQAGDTWGGGDTFLASIDDPAAISRIILFDTWTLNIDRCPPATSIFVANQDNVFFVPSARQEGSYTLIAMDHTHCFGGEALTESLAASEMIETRAIYGMFPEFRAKVTPVAFEASLQRLNSITRSEVNEMVSAVPREWGFAPSVRSALAELIYRRAAFLVGNPDIFITQGQIAF